MLSPDMRQPRPVGLSAGAHLSPDEGTCLMEAVSVAAHLPWSDAPSCTHPLLAHLARLVNDSVSDQGRQRLAALVPDLQNAHPANPADAAYASARIATACTRRALRIHPSPLLTFLHHAAVTALEREHRLRSRGPDRVHDRDASPAPGLRTRVRRCLFGRGPAMRGAEAAVAACLRLDEAERDRALAALLQEALLLARTEQPPSVRVG